MKPENLSLVYFSPTSTTRIVMEEIARGMGKEVSEVIDITIPEIRRQTGPVLENKVVLLGAPVYAGRIPKDAAAYFKTIHGSGCLAVLVVVYGNREFEDALLELKDIAVETGCVPFGAGAFIGEHSFSCDEFAIAQNRPDEKDLNSAFLFGKQMADGLKMIHDLKDLTPVQVPGNFPYREGMADTAFKFITVTQDCDECGICVTVCPKKAVDDANFYSTLDEHCIFCCACIKACPQHARMLMEGPIRDKAAWLSENCSQRKEPEIFLPEPYFSGELNEGI